MQARPLTAREYLDNFRDAIHHAIKKFEQVHPNTYSNLIAIIKNEIINLNFSDLQLWDALNNNCQELYKNKMVPRFILKDDLDVLLQFVLKKCFPRKEVEKYEIQYLREFKREASIKIDVLKRTKKLLKNENEFLKTEMKQTQEKQKTFQEKMSALEK